MTSVARYDAAAEKFLNERTLNTNLPDESQKITRANELPGEIENLNENVPMNTLPESGNSAAEKANAALETPLTLKVNVSKSKTGQAQSAKGKGKGSNKGNSALSVGSPASTGTASTGTPSQDGEKKKQVKGMTKLELQESKKQVSSIEAEIAVQAERLASLKELCKYLQQSRT